MHIARKSAWAGLLALGLSTLAACNGGSSGGSGAPVTQVPVETPLTRGYQLTLLVTGTASEGGTATTDANLSKPWDLAAGDGPVWVANAHTNVATAYDANGVPQRSAIRIPGSRGGSHVTGVVLNAGGTGFQASANGVSGPATHLFSTSSGTLAAWSTSPGFGDRPVTVYSDPTGSTQYTGLALLAAGGTPFLYAVDFQHGRIDTFDGGFNKVATSGNFRDPGLPAGYMPFNIQTLGDRLAVVYVKAQTVNGVTTLDSRGAGFIDLFDASGNLEQRLASGAPLNAPRGIALAPDGFGELGGKVLVANSGDGRINAFDRRTGAFAGTLNDAAGLPVSIPGLSGLGFRHGDRIGSAAAASTDNVLFYTAGTSNSLQSAFGRLQPAPVGSGTAGGGSTAGNGALPGSTAP